ncbi:hypothetical protein [Leifsonia sp. A12D58]|uniref:hypothetical protein n=1 Tax=Leifsonia sp. A12D58 TaxID=3397674 RepID=UPI0039E1F3D4
MTGDFWWVPSVIVFAIAAGVVALLVGASRRRTRARLAAESAADAALARDAAISLVRADDIVQANADELAFAYAQFGEPATREFAQALVTSRRQLSEAFALQQKLDDSVPDTEAERRRWNEQIIRLANDATGRLTSQAKDFAVKRGTERNAPITAQQLTRRLDRAADRIAGGAATINRLSLSYAPNALAGISGNVELALAALVEARAAQDVVSQRLESGSAEPVGEQLTIIEQGLFRATQLLDAIEIGEDQLHVQFATLQAALDEAETELAEARALRDRHEEADASAELNQVIARADALIHTLRDPARLSDPVGDLAALRTAMDGLDITRSEARNRQLRLENARTALSGALLTARSQIQVTREFITANRSRVGAGARTRLAEAERQLALAEVESDPVTALDTARRAMMHATDADALARFDTH